MYISSSPQADTGAESNADADEEQGDTGGFVFNWYHPDDDEADDVASRLQILEHFARSDGHDGHDDDDDDDVEEDEYDYDRVTAEAYRMGVEEAEQAGEWYDVAAMEYRQEDDLLPAIPVFGGRARPMRRTRSRDRDKRAVADDEESFDDSVGRPRIKKRTRSRPDTAIAAFSLEENDKVCVPTLFYLHVFDVDGLSLMFLTLDLQYFSSTSLLLLPSLRLPRLLPTPITTSRRDFTTRSNPCGLFPLYVVVPRGF